MKERPMKERPVVVTTDKDKRGVFFGYTDQPADSAIITLKQARMIVYWSAETRGVLGLASIGPKKGSRVTPPVPSITLQGVTAVMEMTSEAVKQMESVKWS